MAHLATGIFDSILTCSVQPGTGPVDAGLDALAFAWLSREWVALPGYMWPPQPFHFDYHFLYLTSYLIWNA